MAHNQNFCSNPSIYWLLAVSLGVDKLLYRIKIFSLFPIFLRLKKFVIFPLGMQDAITETYSAYGCMLKPGQVAPVGEAFREFKRMYGDEYLTLYNTNGVYDHHASISGSYLSACVHFSTLFGEPCTGNSYRRSWRAGKDNGKTYKITDENTKKLQETADKIVGTKDLRKKYFLHRCSFSKHERK